MQQQINLFQPVFRKQQKVFSALTLLQITVAVSLVLLILYGYAQFSLHRLKQTEAGLQQQFDHLSHEVSSRQTSEQSPELATLEQEVAALEQELASKQALIHRFEAVLVEGGTGFAGHLEALAQLRTEGLWLTGLSIEARTGDLSLRGTALAPGLVPLYLEQLPGQPVLRRFQFRSVELLRRADETGRLDFVLQTQPASGAPHS